MIPSHKDDHGYVHFDYTGIPMWRRIPHKCCVGVMKWLTLVIIFGGLLGGLLSIMKGCMAFFNAATGGAD